MNVTRTALVTGGGSGIGAACVDALAARGWNVAVIDVDPATAGAAAEKACADHGIRAEAFAADVTDADRVAAVVDEIVQRFGRLDGAVNNAGIGPPRAAVADIEPADWYRVVDVNLHGVFHFLRAELRAMRSLGGGAIVNMGSVMSVLGSPTAAAYGASKHAVVGLTRAAALDHAADGIRVNVVGPGFVRTPLLETNQTEEAKAELARAHPRGRLAEPEEIATLVAFLLSPDAANITGGFYANDGGYTIQ